MDAIDASHLLLILNPNAPAPIDPATGKTLEKAKERFDLLIATLEKRRRKIIVPTPAYSEVLVRAGAARNDYLRLIEASACFEVRDFCKKAAIEVADMTRSAIESGDKRDGSDSTWAKIKFDRQIVAIAKVHGASAIYSDDPDVRNIAARLGIATHPSWLLPLPPEEKQPSLELAGGSNERQAVEPERAIKESEDEQEASADATPAGEDRLAAEADEAAAEPSRSVQGDGNVVRLQPGRGDIRTAVAAADGPQGDGQRLGAGENEGEQPSSPGSPSIIS